MESGKSLTYAFDHSGHFVYGSPMVDIATGLKRFRERFRAMGPRRCAVCVWAAWLAVVFFVLTVSLALMKNHMIRQHVNVWEDIEFRAMDLKMAYGLDLNPTVVADYLVRAIIQIESSGNPHAVGAAGERGLMQIMPGTWRDTTKRAFGTALSFDRAFDPELNQRIGRLYLSHIQQFIHAHRDQWQADERSLILASYNGGHNRVKRAGFNLKRLPDSVQEYVRRGSELHDAYLQERMALLESP